MGHPGLSGRYTFVRKIPSPTGWAEESGTVGADLGCAAGGGRGGAF